MSKSMLNMLTIPEILKNRPQWVMWGYRSVKNEDIYDEKGSLIKEPYMTSGYHASSTKPATWVPFNVASKCWLNGYFNGIGYVVGANDNITCIDIDHCIDSEGHLADYANDIVNMFDGTYIEISPSGDGLHIWCLGFAPLTGKRFIHPIEVYGTDKTGRESPRFLTVTGHVLSGDFMNPQVLSDVSVELDWLQEMYGLPDGAVMPKKWSPISLPTPVTSPPVAPVALPVVDNTQYQPGGYLPEGVYQESQGVYQQPQGLYQPPVEYAPANEGGVLIRSKYVEAILSREEATLAGLPKNSIRNDTLFKFACNWIRIGQSNWTGVTFSQISGRLMTAARSSGLGDVEIGKTLNSAVRSVGSDTRQPPKD